jgi:peptide/nickel transport system substrate-binding protein
MPVPDEKEGWKQFRRLSLDSKKVSKRVKKAETATVRHARKFIVGRLDNIRSVRRHIIVWLSLVGVAIAAVSLQLTWFQESYRTTAAASGGTYAEASLGPIDTLNPLYAASSAETATSRLLFSSLYSYDTTGHLQGDLAENMQVDATGMIYTIKIRDNVKWHDGAQLTAKDIAFTVNLIKDPEVRSPLRINWRDVEVKAVDDTTVQFQLPAIYAAFPHALTFAVLPEHLLGQTAPGAIRENSFSRSPVGSGPFSMRLLQNADAASGQKVVNMTAFEQYYGGMPKLGRFEVHAYDTQSDIIKALRSGEVSAATDVFGVDETQVDTHNYNVIIRPINSGTYALLNNDSPILKEKAVRQALQLATDTKAIRKRFDNKVPALDSPFIDDQLTGTDVPHAPAPDLARAKALLDQAGWKMDGDVRKKGEAALELNIATTKNTQYEKALEVLAGQWRKLGVDISTNITDTSNPSTNFIQTVLQPRNYDVLLYELFIGADPDVYAYWHSSQIGMSGYNFSNYSNSTADDALASARSRLEPDLRNIKYKAFAKQWLDDVPAIGLYQSVAEYVVNKHASAFDPSAALVSSQDRFADVLYWSVETESVYKTP